MDTQAETQVENALKNPASGSETTGNTDLFAKIGNVARGAYERTVSIVKNGRGRPRKDGLPKKSDVVEEIPDENRETLPDDGFPDTVVPPASGFQALGAGTWRRCVSAFLKGLLAVPNMLLHKRTAAKYGESRANETLKQCMPTDEEIDDLATFGDILMKKYQVDTKYAPEAVGVSLLVGIGSRYATAFLDTRAPKVQPDNLVAPDFQK